MCTKAPDWFWFGLLLLFVHPSSCPFFCLSVLLSLLLHNRLLPRSSASYGGSPGSLPEGLLWTVARANRVALDAAKLSSHTDLACGRGPRSCQCLQVER